MRLAAFAVGAALSLVSAASADAPSIQARRDAERRIARWSPATEDRYTPPACIRTAAIELVGGWTSGDESVSSELRFASRNDSRVDVAFSTRMMFVDWAEGWSLERTAEVVDGAVVLDRAVEDLSGIYKRLWPVVAGPYKQVVLVPSTALDKVRRAYSAGGCADFAAAFECKVCFGRAVGSKVAP